MRRTIVIVFFCLLAVGALAGLVHINTDLGQTSQSTYVFRDYIFDDIVFTTNQNFNNPNKGAVEIYARSITIPSGVTISARGTGGYGGGGGGGGGGRDGWDGVGGGGRGGYNGNLSYPTNVWGQNGNEGDWGGSSGAGGPGGVGGQGQRFDDDRSVSGYPYSETVYKGNGGDGGSGGGGGGGQSWEHHDEEGAGGGGGGGGGSGGGTISLFAANRIFVGGNITSEGTAGGAGGSKGSRTKGILRYGGDGGAGGTSGQPGGSGGKGYNGHLHGESNGGAGTNGWPGDILLACYSGDVEVHGALFADTLKVFHGGSYVNTGGGAGAATVWTNVYSNVTAWGYATTPSFLPIPVLCTNQPAREATVTTSGDNYIVTARYTNTFTLFTADDVSSPRGNGVTNVTFTTVLRFVVPQSTGTKTFSNGSSGMSYQSSYTNGIRYDDTSILPGQPWRMNSAGTYVYGGAAGYRSVTDVRGKVVGQSVCASNHMVSAGVTNYGPASIKITVSGGSATVPALTNFWLFPTTMYRYDDSVPTSYEVTRVVVTNTWSVGTNYIKEMNGERPRQSWQSNSTREWPMPNQESGWQ